MGAAFDNKRGMADALEGRAAATPGEKGPRTRCPHCGRVLQAPPGTGTVGLGCKSCLHCYRYDYATGAMTPLGHIEPPPGHPLACQRRRERLRNLIALFFILLAFAILSWPLFSPWLSPGSPNSPPDATPSATLEEIQRQLKSLTD